MCYTAAHLRAARESGVAALDGYVEASLVFWKVPIFNCLSICRLPKTYDCGRVHHVVVVSVYLAPCLCAYLARCIASFPGRTSALCDGSAC